MGKRPGSRNVVIDDDLWKRLKKAAIDKDKQLKDLLAEIIKDWLKREGER